MIKLKRVRIQRFRNVKPGTELVFADGFNVLLGKNGSGKTTLLRLLEAISCSDFSPFKDEELELEYECVVEGFSVSAFVRNDRLPQRELVGQETIFSEYVSGMELEIHQLVRPEDISLVVATREGRTQLSLNGAPAQDVRPVVPTQPNFMVRAVRSVAQDFRYLALLVAFSRPGARRFDESLGYYEDARSRELPGAGFASGGGPGEDIFVPGRLVVLSASPQGGERTVVRFPAAQVGPVARIVEALGLSTAEVQLRVQRTDPNGEEIFGGFRFWFTRRDGSQFSDSILSYGQKRLASFLYYLAANQDLVIADELVNGLHHDWIELCIREIGDRQAFLTSQNPLLMDYLSFSTAEEVQRSFILCELGYEGDAEQLRWRNMTDAEAKKVFEASEIGIEHLSTILRNEGLW